MQAIPYGEPDKCHVDSRSSREVTGPSSARRVQWRYSPQLTLTCPDWPKLLLGLENVVSSASSQPSSIARNGPSLGIGWRTRRYSYASSSSRSARLTVFRARPTSRAIALIDSSCTSRRRRILPIVSTHNTPVLPRQPVRLREGTGWSIVDADYPVCLVRIARRFTADVFDYIEVFYNRTRRQRHLGGVGPEAFELASQRGSAVS
jgi:hypothetical protein